MTGTGSDAHPCVLVTGGAGYVGSMLIPALLDTGFRVRVLDIMFYGDAALNGYCNKVEMVVKGDIRRPPTNVLKGVDIIVNLGALSTEPAAEYQPEANRQINWDAAIHLAELAKEAGVSRFIQASSGSIYDMGSGHPQQDRIQDEEAPVLPFRLYSIAKREAEKGILRLADERFSPVVLRKGSIYGYSQRTRMDLVVNAFVRHAMATGKLILHNGGEMWRPLLSIHDAVAAYLLVIAAPADVVTGQIYNVLNENYKISELAQQVKHILGRVGIKCEIEPDHQYRNLRSCRISGRKFAEKLGFVPRFDVESAVIELVSKMRSGDFPDPDNPVYDNIRWLDLMEKTRIDLGLVEPVFNMTFEEMKHVREAACGYSSLEATAS